MSKTIVSKSPVVTRSASGNIISNTLASIAPTNNSSPNDCSSLIVINNSKKYSNAGIKCDSLIAQHVDSSRDISKNSLRLDITSKTTGDNTLGAQLLYQPQPQFSITGDDGDDKIEIASTPKCSNTVSPSMQATPSPNSAHQQQNKKSVKRNFSIISFKSLDFNLKSICSSMKGKHGKDTNSSGSGKSTTVPTASSSKTSITTTTKAPYLKVETVDQDVEEEHLLISFPQSPYSHRGSFDKTQSQHLTTIPSDYSRSQTSSPFLSISTPPNIRRSSTSDIIDNKPALPSTANTPSDSRRPSTSSLLRRARERKGSDQIKAGMFIWDLFHFFSIFRKTNEYDFVFSLIRVHIGGVSSSNKMGQRSLSHGGLPRGGGRMGRRTSMAF